MKIGIIGGGKVGCCLAEYLQNHLVGITASTSEKNQQLAKRFHTSSTTTAEVVAQAEVILLTVPDRKIGVVAQEIASAQEVSSKIFLHCSGSLGLEPLQALAEKGAHCGSMHPLQSFAGGTTKVQGVYMAVDGDEPAQAKAKEIVELLGGNSFHVPAKERAAYHAAACFCSNYAVTIEALAQKLMSRWTGSEEASWQALLPLFKGTATNLQNTSKAGNVLTGPVARGDINTIEKHLQALPNEYLSIYKSLCLATTQLALSNETIDAQTAHQLKNLLKLKNVQNSEE
ncbi:MAG: DUF2520 domain-containing protein [Phascolarctobacterium sp.]|nr:DUF2520 domain-containing protein [Phascolarctobacterium sp.]MBQ9764551.1 DUF2520 domain-containing protein [Phascolarctobacterium sp.]